MSKAILEYVGLDTEKIPDELKTEKPKYDAAKTLDNSALYKIYKRIPVKDIEILVSDTDRTTDVKERYAKSIPLDEFIQEHNTEFENLAKRTKQSLIDELEKQQESFKNNIPYFIKYDKNYIWQIFYSKSDDKYFMLFPTKEGETEALFYLIKKKLEKEQSYIYVPICKEGYSNKLMDTSKIRDLENYIWMFTSAWPQIFEVCINNVTKLYITGQIKIQQDFSTKYRIEIKNEKDADTQYTLFKALYVISNETKNIYKFTPQINSKGSLILTYKDEEINIGNLKEFITTETARQQNLKYEYKLIADENDVKLKRLNKIINKQIEVYNNQEKQISAFMSYRKTFFGRVKLFFTNNKKVSLTNKMILEKIEKEEKEAKEAEEENEIKMSDTDMSDITLNMFTIADLVNTSIETKKAEDRKNDIDADIKAAKIKQKNMERKIKNAQIYIDEIEKHKKSLLEFWKFTNKDNQTMLNKGGEESKEESKQISFCIDEGFEEFAEEVDSFQRQKLSKEECDAVFVAKYLLPSVNSVITRSDTFRLDEAYDELKEQYDNQSHESSIFGNILDDHTKVKMINNKKHRENRKELFSILKFNESTTLDDFKERMREIGILVNEAYQKLTTKYDMTVYYSKRNKGYIMGDIDPYKLLKDSDVKKIYKMQTSKETHLIFLSNIIFYDNVNKTLPLGMDESTNFITKVGENRKVGDSNLNLLIENDIFDVEVRKIKIIEEAKRN